MSDNNDHKTPPLSSQDTGLGQPEPTSTAETAAGTPKPIVKKGPIELTSVEGVLFFNIVRFSNDTASVDWDQVAIHSNLKNAASAKVRYRQIQKKYELESLTTGGKAPTTKTTTTKAAGTGAQKGGGRKRKATTGTETEEGGNGGATEETPSKKQPARKKSSTAGSMGTKAKAKGKKKDTATDTTGHAGANNNSQSEAVVKKEPDTQDVIEMGANPLPGLNFLPDGNGNMNANPSTREASVFPVGFNFNHAQQASNAGLRHPQQMILQQQPQQPQHGFGRAFNPAAFNQGYHHMGGNQFGHLDADPAGFFGPPMSEFMNSTGHGFLHGGHIGRQQNSSPHRDGESMAPMPSVESPADFAPVKDEDEI